jgi:hypothetical protein
MPADTRKQIILNRKRSIPRKNIRMKAAANGGIPALLMNQNPIVASSRIERLLRIAFVNPDFC